MIHDAKVEITCDGSHCQTSIEITPDFTYRSYSGSNGSYDTRDEAIEEKLEHEGWFIADGKHYCSDGCVPSAVSEGESNG